MDPAAVGHNGKNIVMGKHSGRAAFKHTLATLGVDLNPSLFEKAFMQMKTVADQQGEVNETQMRWIVADVSSGLETFEGVAESFQ